MIRKKHSKNNKRSYKHWLMKLRVNNKCHSPFPKNFHYRHQFTVIARQIKALVKNVIMHFFINSNLLIN